MPDSDVVFYHHIWDVGIEEWEQLCNLCELNEVENAMNFVFYCFLSIKGD